MALDRRVPAGGSSFLCRSQRVPCCLQVFRGVLQRLKDHTPYKWNETESRKVMKATMDKFREEAGTDFGKGTSGRAGPGLSKEDEKIRKLSMELLANEAIAGMKSPGGKNTDEEREAAANRLLDSRAVDGPPCRRVDPRPFAGDDPFVGIDVVLRHVVGRRAASPPADEGDAGE